MSDRATHGSRSDAGMDIVAVDLGPRSYEVLIGQGLVARAGEFIAPLLRRPKVAVITDQTVAEAHLLGLTIALEEKGIALTALALPPGEATKSWDYLTRATEWMLEHKVERGDLVVALGGGVIGDLAGFAASILRRGVRFLQVPTTLLAQVDSSVGGKTGINSGFGKNLIGAFHQPVRVLADIDLLDSLPAREFLSGYGEVVKYGLLGDADFFARLERDGKAILAGDKGLRQQAVTRSVTMKAGIVARDETEEGERALLNLGHTFAHALERVTGYSDRLLHGEAVAIGCALAFDLSQKLGLCPQEDPSRVRAHLRSMGMKVDLSDIAGDLPPADDLLAIMAQDKKVIDGRLRLILARGIGQAFVAEDAPREAVRALLTEALAGQPRIH
jgi:3-dehydroquinate synthase